VSAARTRLAALAAAAGYPADLLCQIAVATLPAYTPGDTLGDAGVDHVASAVELLAEAGHDAHRARELIARHQLHGATRWRDALWREVLGAAVERAQPTASPSA
jgi:hypothetical protein